jgi:hypothetical protein
LSSLPHVYRAASGLTRPPIPAILNGQSGAVVFVFVKPALIANVSGEGDAMLGSEVSSNPLVSLANKPATVQQRQFALVVAVLLFVGLAVAAPFADTPLN